MRKSIHHDSIESVYQTRLTLEEKKNIQATLLDIKSMLIYSRKYPKGQFAYGTNGAIIEAALTDYKVKLQTFLKNHKDKSVSK